MLVSYRRRLKHFFYYLSIIVGVLACAMIFQACTGAKNPKPLRSFSEFALTNEIPMTADCAEKCVMFKKEFRYIQFIGENIYCYWDEKKQETGTDFNALASQLESQINDQTSLQDYYLILMKWAAAFHDGHVNVMSTDAVQGEIEFFDPNIRFEVLAPGTPQEKLIIAKLSDEAGSLVIGTEVLKINGKNWQEYYSEALSMTSGSTERMRRKSAARRIPLVLGFQDGFSDIHVEGVFRGQAVEGNVSRNVSLNDGSAASETETTGMELLKVKIVEGNLGYLRIDGFQGTKMAELLEQVMQKLSQTSGLLIDVRLNGGGNQTGNVVLSRLISSRTIRYSQKVRNSEILMSLRPDYFAQIDLIHPDWSEIWSASVSPKATTYSKPVVVLTSSQCFSACDTFVSALKENKLAKVIGESTGGGTGTPVVFDLPVSSMQFRYSVAKGYTAVSQEIIEGKGTLVDDEIFPTIEERISGKDLQLSKAFLYLRKLISPLPPEVTTDFVIDPLVSGGKIEKSALRELNEEIRLNSIEDQAK